MNKHHREEAEMKGRGRHREKKEGHKKHMSHGGHMSHGDIGFNGERTHNTKDYSNKEFHPVDRMLRDEHSVTNMGTIECAKHGGHMGKAKHMAAGGAAKERKGQYYG